SAALIKKDQPEQPSVREVRNELAALLPAIISPVMMVSQIMSKRPRVITLTTGVDEAARLMSRYGYEGFPVLKDGHVAGLLTRRVVDKAVSHKLKLTAASLMEAGEYSVHPADSFQRLQNVMTESGWGQIPVVDPESSKIIGIVTRTDVLKVLSKQHPQLIKNVSLADKLKKNLPAEKISLLRAVAEQADGEHLPVYIVGGFVRDLLLDLPGSDLDLVVEGDAIKLAEKLVSLHGGTLKSHSRFGTARGYLEKSEFEFKPEAGLEISPAPQFLDLISARQEFYEHPSALPTVEHSNIRLDLHRRDFTINTLALRIDGRYFGELHDYYGGKADLEKRVVRVLHSLSFIDDPTRMIRAVRYEQRYKFEIEPRTLQLIDEARPLLARLSPERLRHEFELLLQEKSAPLMMKRLDQLGLIKAINEQLPWNKKIQKWISDLYRNEHPADHQNSIKHDRFVLSDSAFCLWFLELTAEQINELQQQFGFSNHTLKTIQASAALFAAMKTVNPVKPSEWVELLDGYPLLAVRMVFFVTREGSLGEYLSTWQHIQPQANGHSVKKLGLRPGPIYQDILRTLRNAWLDGELKTFEDEKIMLQHLLINAGK
ncbi:MAG: CBS domain-containing protein, partial [Chloroflexota bacterium]